VVGRVGHRSLAVGYFGVGGVDWTLESGPLLAVVGLSLAYEAMETTRVNTIALSKKWAA